MPKSERPQVTSDRATNNAHEIRIQHRHGMVCFSFGTLEAHVTCNGEVGTVHLNEKETRDLFECLAAFNKVSLPKEYYKNKKLNECGELKL